MSGKVEKNACKHGIKYFTTVNCTTVVNHQFTTDYNGLQWITMIYNGLQQITIVYNRLQWITMVYNRLQGSLHTT